MSEAALAWGWMGREKVSEVSSGVSTVQDRSPGAVAERERGDARGEAQSFPSEHVVLWR